MYNVKKKGLVWVFFFFKIEENEAMAIKQV